MLSRSSKARSSASGILRPFTRRATKRPMGDSPKRRPANSTIPADGASSHWTSSTATRSGASRASRSSRPTTAAAIAPCGGGLPGASSRKRAMARACRWGTGSSSAASSKAVSSKSRSAENENVASAPLGLQASTRQPRARARSTPARQSVVFPAPGSPSRTSAAGPSPTDSRNAPMAVSSSSRPTTGT